MFLYWKKHIEYLSIRKSHIVCLNSQDTTYIFVWQLHFMPISFKLKSIMVSKPIAHLVLVYSRRLACSGRHLWRGKINWTKHKRRICIPKLQINAFSYPTFLYQWKHFYIQRCLLDISLFLLNAEITSGTGLYKLYSLFLSMLRKCLGVEGNISQILRLITWVIHSLCIKLW